ncbi:MAG TPA: enoyl-ACP reductase [Chthonomonadaceae bacterium]|nr:enoyl-ACP reductase [Chthonomonadaceae bacterium]
MPGVMEGRRVLVTGARNKWSIAWHVALSLQREGAQLAFSVLGEREMGGVGKLLNDAGFDAPIWQCDATDEAQIEELYRQVGAAFDGGLDGLLHGVVFANKDELSGEYVATSRSGFTLAQESSVYTLVSLARGARPLMQAAGGGSIVTLTYLGAERVVPNYNVMGVAKAALEASVRYLAADLGKENIRVNAVSAGPIKTLAASGIAGFDAMVRHVAERAPLRRAVDADEVGDAALFLFSPWARGITGEVLYVDGGYHIMGM